MIYAPILHLLKLHDQMLRAQQSYPLWVTLFLIFYLDLFLIIFGDIVDDFLMFSEEYLLEDGLIWAKRG